MAKEENKQEKEHQEAHKVYKAGDKYHCAECGAEIDFGSKCPTCKLDIDWKMVEGSIRR